jgi:hypothetical protein
MRMYDAKLPICALFCTEIESQNRKTGAIPGRVCNLNELNTLSEAAGSCGIFSTKTPLSILTTIYASQWRSSKMSEWLEQGKHAT